MTLKNKVAEWLESLEDVTEVEPVTLTIGTQTWEGAVYTLRGQRSYYLAGDLPKSYAGQRTCYRLPGDDRDWYVACYMEADRLTPEFKQHHSFGANWMMRCWTVSGKIDDYAPLGVAGGDRACCADRRG